MKRLLLVITLAFGAICVLHAQDFYGRYRFTDQYGRTTGYAKPTWNGDGWEYTDQYGRTTGHLRPNWNGDGFRWEPEP